MHFRFLRASRLVLLASTIVGLLAPAPAVAQFGNLFGGKSKESEAEAVADGEGEQSAAETGDSADKVPDDEIIAAEQNSATSFDNLCGNGQGRPEEGEVRPKRKGLFGVADRMASATRKIPLVGDFLVDSANSLSQAVSCRLYPEEQEQAAEATQIATEGGEIGKTIEWQSSVRENVSGSSTVSSKNALPDGTPCMVLADIVIVDGEELKVSKTMCKLPGAARYTIVKV